jgi:hypothetical protein
MSIQAQLKGEVMILINKHTSKAIAPLITRFASLCLPSLLLQFGNSFVFDPYGSLTRYGSLSKGVITTKFNGK